MATLRKMSKLLISYAARILASYSLNRSYGVQIALDRHESWEGRTPSHTGDPWTNLIVKVYWLSSRMMH